MVESQVNQETETNWEQLSITNDGRPDILRVCMVTLKPYRGYICTSSPATTQTTNSNLRVANLVLGGKCMRSGTQNEAAAKGL